MNSWMDIVFDALVPLDIEPISAEEQEAIAQRVGRQLIQRTNNGRNTFGDRMNYVEFGSYDTVSMAGPVKVYYANVPLGWLAFMRMKESSRANYLNALIGTYHATTKMIGDMLGVEESAVDLEIAALNERFDRVTTTEESPKEELWKRWFRSNSYRRPPKLHISKPIVDTNYHHVSGMRIGYQPDEDTDALEDNRRQFDLLLESMGICTKEIAT